MKADPVLSRRQWSLTALACVACRRRRGTGFPGYALVASAYSPSVAAVNLATFSLAAKIEAPAPVCALQSHPGRPCGWALASEPATVMELDTARLRVTRRLSVGRLASGMHLSAGGELLWVLCRKPPQLVGVNTRSWERAVRVSLPESPLDFDVAPDGRWAAASMSESGSLVFVELASGRALAPLSLGRRASLVSFRSDGRLLLAANADWPGLSIVEVPSGAVVVHLPLALRPAHFCFKADGGQLFITGEGADGVAIVYPYRTEVAETILAGKSPAEMAVSTAPEYLFVANPESGDVAVIEIETRRLIALAPVGVGVHALAVTPDSQYLLALNESAGTMAVVRIPAITARRTRMAPLFTVVPVGPRPTALAVSRL